MNETVALDVNLRAYVRRDTTRRWVAVCPMIGVASQGTTEREAKRCLQEAVELWFESCIERGVLDQALREANFRPLAVVESAETRRKNEGSVLGEHFAIHLTIPAYQAATLLSAAP